MPWVRFRRSWNWLPRPQISVYFKAGHRYLVTRACAECAIKAGVAERIKRPDQGEPEGDDASR